ncbi:RNA polymerase sigma factor [Neolewinella persica]|uniref:RNA polymerase sigma factor n=1 Tax=Neolewinella persica TaxID=70998 RepID=UPI00036F0985|nr:RNA polymerase sigma factor [Neolewinella persica]
MSLPISLESKPATVQATPAEELLRRCVEQDPRAQREFFNHHYRMVLGIASRYALDQQQARDFLNRSFLKAFSSLTQFRGDGEIGGWLRMITVNVCLAQIRTKRNQSYAELPETETEFQSPQALQQLALEDLVGLIQQLPPVPRAVFNLTAVEGMSHRDVSLRLGIKETTSRYHLRQARLRLQAAINHLNR